MILLKSFALTLEVFLHHTLGERYLTWPRMLLGLLAIWFMAHVGLPWDWAHADAGFMSIWYPHVTFMQVGRVLGIEWSLPFFTRTEFEGVSVIAVLLSLYVAAAEAQMLLVFMLNRFAIDTHNRSSGEAYGMWDGFYIFFDSANFRGDLVKQICEPILCFVAGICVFILPREFRGVAMWLMLGSLALFFKAWLENRARKKQFLDKAANRMDMAAIREQRGDGSQEEIEDFAEVPKFFE